MRRLPLLLLLLLYMSWHMRMLSHWHGVLPCLLPLQHQQQLLLYCHLLLLHRRLSPLCRRRQRTQLLLPVVVVTTQQLQQLLSRNAWLFCRHRCLHQ